MSYWKVAPGRPQWFMLFIVAISMTLPGCFAVYTYHLTHVMVRDAETEEAIPHARVSVSYPHMFLLNAPPAKSSDAGEDGTVSILTATLFRVWNVSAPDYMDTDSRYSKMLAVQGQQNPRNELDVRLYRLPAPTITIVLPTGYRGPLKIDKTLLKSYVQEAVGKRQFLYEASQHGYVHIDATPLLLRLEAFPVKAQYANGEVITYTPDTPGSVALRWVTAEGTRDLYVVGTEKDEEAVLSRIFKGDVSHRQLDEKAFAELFEER